MRLAGKEASESDSPSQGYPKQLAKRTSKWVDEGYVHFEEGSFGEIKSIGLLG
jgi:hypothetical protein